MFNYKNMRTLVNNSFVSYSRFLLRFLDVPEHLHLLGSAPSARPYLCENLLLQFKQWSLLTVNWLRYFFKYHVSVAFGKKFHTFQLKHHTVLKAGQEHLKKEAPLQGLTRLIGVLVQHHKHVAHIFIDCGVEPAAHIFESFGSLCLFLFVQHHTGARLLRVVLLVIENPSCVGRDRSH